MAIKYCASIDNIVKPVVTMNGDRVVQARVVNQVGEIPSATVLIKPEDVSKYSSPDQEVKLNISNVPGGGMLFKGYLSGVNFSNMSGNISAGVDIIHKARDLQETSSVVPGASKSGNAEVESILYREPKKLMEDSSGAYQAFDLTKPFPNAICDGLIEWLNSSFQTQIPDSQAGEKAKAISMLSSISSESKDMGTFFAPELKHRASRFISNILERSHISSDIWDVLSIIIGSFDATLVCLPDGRIIMTPNFCGVKASSNEIQSEIIQKMDRSCQIKRSPKECLIMAPVCTSQIYNKAKPNPVAQAVDSNPGTRGSLFISAPGWIGDIDAKGGAELGKKGMDKLAEAILYREAHKTRTFNIVTPICRSAVPGTCATFIPASGVKNFNGSPIDIFEEKFDGYCYKIEHILDVESWTTIFHFQSCVESSSGIQKLGKHPLFPEAKMIEWDK
jgi:hypothetical protein